MVSLWVVATVGVTYVASAAVALVDLQVFPQGERVEVLARPAPPPTTTILPTSTTSGGSTNTTTVPATTVPDSGEEPTPTTTVAPATTTTRPVPPVAINTAGLTAATVGSAYDVELVSIGGQLPHTWQVVTGVLPPGLALSSAGRISGTPQTVGQYSFSVRVADGLGRSASASFVLTTVEALRVLTTSLPEVEAGSPYQATFDAIGGSRPYRWAVIEGRLPDGLVLSTAGVVSGTSSGGLPTTVAVTATDSSGRVAHSGVLAVDFATDRRTVAARGGTVFVDVLGDSVSLFLASPADGFSAIVVESSGYRVEVQFIPLQGDATSWVVCEVADGVSCFHG